MACVSSLEPRTYRQPGKPWKLSKELLCCSPSAKRVKSIKRILTSLFSMECSPSTGPCSQSGASPGKSPSQPLAIDLPGPGASSANPYEQREFQARYSAPRPGPDQNNLHSSKILRCKTRAEPQFSRLRFFTESRPRFARLPSRTFLQIQRAPHSRRHLPQLKVLLPRRRGQLVRIAR